MESSRFRFDETGVTFRFKDYRRAGTDRQQVMTLAADEFIRRFLLHVLPKGFHRIRHYGLLAGARNSSRKPTFRICPRCLGGVDKFRGLILVESGNSRYAGRRIRMTRKVAAPRTGRPTPSVAGANSRLPVTAAQAVFSRSPSVLVAKA